MVSPPISDCTPQLGHLAHMPAPAMGYLPLSPIETPKTEHSPEFPTEVGIKSFMETLALLGSASATNTESYIPKVHKRERSQSLDKSLSPEETVVLKRQRNTDAARRSRQRKAVRMDSLEKRVMDLETANEKLRLRTAIAESEKANIEAKEKSSKVRILELERQLAYAHRILLQTTPLKEITA
ncbi:hypothetical protein BY458DRAFT_428605 [Sporodiniella umbellata]|nr:hypothetical protein BY458DRAFT_428605 [Sporodiniella umbellata]